VTANTNRGRKRPRHPNLVADRNRHVPASPRQGTNQPQFTMDKRKKEYLILKVLI
jgi:hypothetical protein